jgi:hypothetical protein
MAFDDNYVQKYILQYSLLFYWIVANKGSNSVDSRVFGDLILRF